MTRRIILFTRYPEPGKTKTRLIPTLGADGATAVHRQLTELALANARAQSLAEVEVTWTGGNEAAMRAWLGPDTQLREQVGGDLGARMKAALHSAFDDGATEALVAGSDCPDLDPETYEAAFDALKHHDLVVGPAADGGYYLIGARAAAAAALSPLFMQMEWSTSRVLAETLGRAEQANMRVAQLATLEDVDLPEDIPAWKRRCGAAPRPALSVIVCALNDAAKLAEALGALGHSEDMEIIVADGGSTDATAEIATQHGATVVHAPRGRAAQFNLGAARASGEMLLFLHADTRVPPNFRNEICACLAQQGTAAGAFRFSTDFASPSMRIVTASANIRARVAQLPYGDQGLFLRRETFHRVGGFPRVPLMEDYILVKRLRQFGHIRTTSSPAITSGDRWRNLGVWHTTLRNARIVALHELGVSPERLAEIYRRPK